MSKQKTKVLELNNIDIYGKQFNGFKIAEQLFLKPNADFEIIQVVNHKLSDAPFVKPLYSNIAQLNSRFETFDWRIDSLEQKLNNKNQFSISEEGLINNSLYKEADILHFHMYHNMKLPIEFLERIPSSKKIILDLHDTFWLTDKNIQMLEVFKFSNPNKHSLDKQRKRIISNPNIYLLAHSPYMLRLAKKSNITNNKKCFYIPLGIDTKIFKPANDRIKIREELNIPTNNIVLFCRAQKEFKGIDYIKEALKTIQSQKPITVITVQEKGLLSNTPNVNIIDFGQVKDDKLMAKLFNCADIFLMPSTEESFGLMAAEAMSCATPVIVFDGTALPDTVNAPKIGISVPKSALELKKAIEHLIQNPEEREERAKKGRVFAKNNYDINVYYQKTLKFYEQISNKKNVNHKRKPAAKRKLSHSDRKMADMIYHYLAGDSDRLPEINNLDYNSKTTQQEIKLINRYVFKKVSKKIYLELINKTTKTIAAKAKRLLYRL